KHSEEGNVDCLGVFDLPVKLFPPHLKVPHMGWNSVNERKGILFNGLRKNATLYYVHSYYAAIGEDTIATNDYILPFSAALQKENIYSNQPHHEKSGKDGEMILKNFLEI